MLDTLLFLSTVLPRLVEVLRIYSLNTAVSLFVLLVSPVLG